MIETAKILVAIRPNRSVLASRVVQTILRHVSAVPLQFDRCDRSARQVHGVTILELLVVFAAITMLASLLLPAILAAREAGRNLECANNLHQIGTALQAFEGIHRFLPAGWSLEPSNRSAYAWAATLLPQVEEGVLNSRIDRTRPVGDVGSDVRTTTPPTYLCPSDYGDDAFPLFAELGEHGLTAQESTQTLVTLPRANYMGMFGTTEPDEVPGELGNGVFIKGRGIRFREISQGLSHVLMVGERTTRKLPSTWLGIAVGGEDAGGRIVGCAYEGPNRDGTDECEFDSRHYGHVNFVWCDGHVSAVEDEIDQQVYRLCAQRR